jgi:hypothetical protein
LHAVAEHQDVPKEKATVETTRALEDQYGDQHLAIGWLRQPNKWTQGDGESWKKLAAVCRWMSWCAIPAWHNGHGHKGPTIKKRQQKGLECNNGIRNQGTGWQLHLRKERTSSRIFRKTVELEIEKQIIEFSTGHHEGVGPL